jgi:SAM-dependent methyltransferase
MKYEEALMKFSKCYKDRYSVEFPTIFNLCDFRNKSILEIGPAEGYFVKEVSKLTSKISTSDASTILFFPDKSFDIVLSRWIVQNVDDLEKAINEMCRVTKNNVIIVLPSEEGDETKMLEIKFPEKFEARKNRIIKIKKQLSKCEFKVKEERMLLNFSFPNVEETIDIFSSLSFNNKLSDKEKIELKEFLFKKKKKDGIQLTQGASFICGYK